MRDAIVQNDDTLGRIVMRYDYDMLGNRIHQASMEAGERWMLNDVAGKPIRAWDSRGFIRRMTYDRTAPADRVLLRDGTAAERAGRAQRVYGEDSPKPDANNLRGRASFRSTTGAGVVTSDDYDFKGNLLRSRRRLAARLQDNAGLGRQQCHCEAETLHQPHHLRCAQPPG